MLKKLKGNDDEKDPDVGMGGSEHEQYRSTSTGCVETEGNDQQLVVYQDTTNMKPIESIKAIL